VAGAEAAEEVGVGDEAAPAGADEGRAGKRGRQRGEAEEEVVDVDRGRPAAHLVPCRLGRPKINRKLGIGENVRRSDTDAGDGAGEGRPAAGAEAEAVANLGVGPQAGLFSRVHLGWADDPSLGWAG